MKQVIGYVAVVVRDYDEAIKLDGKNARLYANRGVIRARLVKSDDAQKDFRKAIDLDAGLKDSIEPLILQLKGK